MRGMVKNGENSVRVQSLKKGDSFTYHYGGGKYDVTVVKRRLPNKQTAILRVTGMKEGEETLITLSRHVWVDLI